MVDTDYRLLALLAQLNSLGAGEQQQQHQHADSSS